MPLLEHWPSFRENSGSSATIVRIQPILFNPDLIYSFPLHAMSIIIRQVYHYSTSVSLFDKCIIIRQVYHYSTSVSHYSTSVSLFDKCISLRQVYHYSTNVSLFDSSFKAEFTLNPIINW